MASFSHENQRIKALIGNPDTSVVYSRHALIRMEKRDIAHADVIRVLTSGQVTWYEVKQDEVVHVEGEDVDSRRIRVVAGLRDAALVIKVITVFPLE
jgi:hypothetical protein